MATPVAAVVRQEWEKLDRSVYKLAYRWVQRRCWALGVQLDSAMVADCVAIAYGRYSTWRGHYTPHDATKKIQSMLRQAARQAVSSQWRNKIVAASDDAALALVAEPGECPSVATFRRLPPDATPNNSNARAMRALCRMPRKLYDTALALVSLPSDGDKLDMLAEKLRVSRSTAVNRLRDVRNHPAMAGLFVTRIVESAAESCGVDCDGPEGGAT